MDEKETWVAFVASPDGQIWESTASLVTGQEAEFKASRWAQQKFCFDLVGHLIKDPPVYQLWEAARRSGFKCICTRIEHSETE